MPVQYASIVEEHQAVRNNVGTFDISHMGQLIAEGSGARDWLNTMLTNNIDKLDVAENAYRADQIDFTIDQQPYLQGFVPIQQLFLHRYSSGLVSPAETNTGLKFVTRANVRRYLTTTTRYEGSSRDEKYPIS